MQQKEEEKRQAALEIQADMQRARLAEQRRA